MIQHISALEAQPVAVCVRVRACVRCGGGGGGSHSEELLGVHLVGLVEEAPHLVLVAVQRAHHLLELCFRHTMIISS
jgi:hypothetical protein